MTIKEQILQEIDSLPEESLANVLEFISFQKYRLGGNSKRRSIFTIDEIKEKITPVAEQYGVKKAYLFGSYARGEATSESDVDICIEKGKIRTMLDLSGFCVDLEESLDGKVDVVTENSLEGNFRKTVEKEKVLVYG